MTSPRGSHAAAGDDVRAVSAAGADPAEATVAGTTGVGSAGNPPGDGAAGNGAAGNGATPDAGPIGSPVTKAQSGQAQPVGAGPVGLRPVRPRPVRPRPVRLRPVRLRPVRLRPPIPGQRRTPSRMPLRLHPRANLTVQPISQAAVPGSRADTSPARSGLAGCLLPSRSWSRSGASRVRPSGATRQRRSPRSNGRLVI